jgi:hypothetical protein
MHASECRGDMPQSCVLYVVLGALGMLTQLRATVLSTDSVDNRSAGSTAQVSHEFAWQHTLSECSIHLCSTRPVHTCTLPVQHTPAVQHTPVQRPPDVQHTTSAAYTSAAHDQCSIHQCSIHLMCSTRPVQHSPASAFSSIHQCSIHLCSTRPVQHTPGTDVPVMEAPGTQICTHETCRRGQRGGAGGGGVCR